MFSIKYMVSFFVLLLSGAALAQAVLTAPYVPQGAARVASIANCGFGEPYQHSDSNVETITMYRFVAGEMFVVLEQDGVILKIKDFGGTGANMFNLRFAGGIYQSGGAPAQAVYLLGEQHFANAIARLAYSNGATFVAFRNGDMLKINGTGGTGQNMFAVTAVSGGYATVPGYAYYSGDAHFNGAATAIAPVAGYTLIGFSNGKMLKVNGAGGTGHNMFAVTETSGGFNPLSGYNYYAGDAMFQSAVHGIYATTPVTFVTLDSGKMLKVNGAGGTGHNMFAVQETSSGFTGFSGYPYYVGDAKFSNLGGVTFAGSYSFIAFSGGKILKINGTGGTGHNMFAVTETPSGFTGLSGYNYYVGHAKYSGNVSDIEIFPDAMLISFDNGKMLKADHVGGSGQDMFNATEDTLGFHRSTAASFSYLLGSIDLDSQITNAIATDSDVIIALANKKLVKVHAAAAGMNMYNLEQHEDGIWPLCDFSLQWVGNTKFN